MLAYNTSTMDPSWEMDGDVFSLPSLISLIFAPGSPKNPIASMESMYPCMPYHPTFRLPFTQTGFP